MIVQQKNIFYYKKTTYLRKSKILIFISKENLKQIAFHACFYNSKHISYQNTYGKRKLSWFLWSSYENDPDSIGFGAKLIKLAVEFFLCKLGRVWIYLRRYLMICKGELSFIKKFRVVLFSYMRQHIVGVMIYLKLGSIINCMGKLLISSKIRLSYIFFWTEGSSNPIYPKKTMI